MNLKKLYEERNAKITAMKAIMSKMGTEERAEMTADETSQFDTLEVEVRALEETIARAEKARDLTLNVVSDAKKEELRAEEREAAEERAFECYLRGTTPEERASVNLTAGDNGAVIPASIANKIIKKVVELSPIFASATRYNVGGTLSIPYYDESTQAITVTYADEFTQAESTSGKTASISLTGFLARALTKVSKSLKNNSQFDIVGFVIKDMSEKFAQFIEGELLNGTTNKIAGLSGATQVVTAASATTVTADELIDLQETVPDVFQAGAYWVMNKSTRTAIRKLKDGQGNYLLQKDSTARWGYSLFGKDVYTSSKAKTMAAGNTAVYYGDFTGLAVKISEDINIQVLLEKYADEHVIGVLGFAELDSKIENQQKIAVLKMKSV
jgi:phage major capsid protein, HK97 family